MSDCLWCFICGLCEGNACYKCPSYLSVNSEEGGKYLQQYQNEVNAALLPLVDIWKEKMNEYTVNK